MIRQIFRRVGRLFNRNAVRASVAAPMVPQASPAMATPVDANQSGVLRFAPRPKRADKSTRARRKEDKKMRATRRGRGQNYRTGKAA